MRPVIFDRPLEGIHQTLKTITGTLTGFATQLGSINRKLDLIMSEDASVLAVVTDETAQVTALGASVGALQALVVALQAEVAAGGTALQPGTLAALQAAQASLDALATTGAADVSTDTPTSNPAGQTVTAPTAATSDNPGIAN